MCVVPVIASAYDEYFRSGLYEARYPRPNPAMARLLRAELPREGAVVDYGCGNGRYLPILLERESVTVTACDVSAVAIATCRRRFAEQVAANRLRTVLGGRDELAREVPAGSQDLVLLLFGVLGHIRWREERIATLRALRKLLRPRGRVVVTVPNRRRRFRAEQAACRDAVADGTLEPGDILYTRRAGRAVVELYYHLYAPAEFLADLAAAGFVRPRTFAESVLPERASIAGPPGAALDAALRRVCPLPLAYGFGAVAERDADG